MDERFKVEVTTILSSDLSKQALEQTEADLFPDISNLVVEAL
jgi:hypothetical protein